MYWETAVTSAIEVGIGLAGFSGIIAAIAARDGSRWGPVQRIRMEILLAASASAVFFCLLPLGLAEAGLAPETMWRAGSSVYGAWLAFIVSVRAREVWREVEWKDQIPIRTAPWFWGMGGVVALQVVNAVWLTTAWPYLVAVLYQLAVAFGSFALMLRDTWSGTA